MTGYGRASEEFGDRTITVELRAVNHRYLDCTVKAPKQYGFLEDAIKKAASARIARGKVEIYVNVELHGESAAAVKMNYAVAEMYLKALRELGERFGLTDDITVMRIASLPDVMCPERVEQNEESLLRDVLKVFEHACESFDLMRTKEGQRMAGDIYEKCLTIAQYVSEIEKRAPERVKEYNERLLTKLREVLADTRIDEARIVTEAAIYADKTAVDEETVRIRSHLHQLDEMLRENRPVGRKLDFLVQELNREANTIGSKANDVELSKLVVEMKSEIEKIREQIQNIE